MGFEKIVHFSPAFDSRDPDPAKNFGIGSVGLFMTLKGELGAATLHLFTGWNLPHVAEEHSGRGIYSPMDIKVLFRPGPAEIAFHSPTPQYEGHSESEGNCPFVAGGKCYQAIGYTIADEVVNALLSEGSDGAFRELERLYNEQFVKEVSA